MSPTGEDTSCLERMGRGRDRASDLWSSCPVPCSHYPTSVFTLGSYKSGEPHNGVTPFVVSSPYFHRSLAVILLKANGLFAFIPSPALWGGGPLALRQLGILPCACNQAGGPHGPLAPLRSERVSNQLPLPGSWQTREFTFSKCFPNLLLFEIIQKICT